MQSMQLYAIICKYMQLLQIIRKVCIHNKNPNDLKKQNVQTSLVQTSTN